MDYISVKDAAVKFGISDRRVQQLCDSGRIVGAQMISGVWVIPEDAPKPADERITTTDQNSELISLNDLCKMLSISVATGRNWIKLGKLTADSMVKKTPYFTTEYASSVKNALQKGDNTVLKSRRNKKYVSGSNIYNSYVSENSAAPSSVQKIIDLISVYQIDIDDLAIEALVAECAIQLLLHDTTFASAGNCLDEYFHHMHDMHGLEFLIDDLISDEEKAEAFIEKYPELFRVTYQYVDNEDILGLLYISVKNLGSRKATGSYYTPTKIVKRLCSKLFEKNAVEGRDILDPCCGTGNFLLQLPRDIPFDRVFGNDTDLLSVKLTRINMALKYGISDRAKLEAHITNQDYLNHAFSGCFDFIIGNPPWGYEYSDDEKNRLRSKYYSAIGSNIESYDVFIEQAMNDLKPNGVLFFVLPEALLNVKSHAPVRKILVDKSTFQYLDFLGNAFDKVQCPCIILGILNTGKPASCIGMEVVTSNRSFTIGVERKILPECFSFLTTDAEYSILSKIGDTNGKCYLAGNATFALGIVTGNNKEYISNTKTPENEMVLKGADLCKYRFHQNSNYIVFKPESFQQIAPIEYYRAPEKLLYRFICNQLVFAYDNQQTLSLNSCNLLIPRLDGLNIKYVLAVLNSRTIQYYFRKMFNSVKVLRSHIEQLPIPHINEEQQRELLPYIETLITAHDSEIIMETYNQLDIQIARLFQLDDMEYQVVKESTEGENLFLF